MIEEERMGKICLILSHYIMFLDPKEHHVVT